jgi:hypothetical protein
LAPVVANATLLSLFLFTRHGARSPGSGYGYPTVGGDWQCGHRYTNRTRTPVVNGIPMSFAFNASEQHRFPPSCHGNSLLDQGFDTMLAVGELYRRYLTEVIPLLPKFMSDRVSVRTTYLSRAIESGLAFFEGFYPPQQDGEILEMVKTNESVDPLLPMIEFVPGDAMKRIDEYLALEDVQNLAEIIKDKYLQTFLDWNFTISGARRLMLAGDVFFTCKCGGNYNESLIPEETLYEMMKDVNLFGHGYFNFLGELGFGPIWQMLVDEIDSFYAGDRKAVFTLYTCHDNTILSMLAGLGYLTDDIYVPYSSHLAVELWYTDHPNLRFVFNGEVLQINGADLIPLSQFKSQWVKGKRRNL